MPSRFCLGASDGSTTEPDGWKPPELKGRRRSRPGCKFAGLTSPAFQRTPVTHGGTDRPALGRPGDLNWLAKRGGSGYKPSNQYVVMSGAKVKCGVSRSQGQEAAFSGVDLLALLAVLALVVCMQLPALAHNKGNSHRAV